MLAFRTLLFVELRVQLTNEFFSCFLAAFDGESGQCPSLRQVGGYASTFGVETGEGEGSPSMALVGGERVKLAGVGDILWHASSLFEECSEVILSEGQAALGGAGEPSDTSRGVGDGEFSGEIKQAEFVLGFGQAASRSGQQMAITR